MAEKRRTGTRFAMKTIVKHAETIEASRDDIIDAWHKGSLDKAAADIIIDLICRSADYYRENGLTSK